MSKPVNLRMLRVGSCRHLECMAVRGGRFAPVDFPALCGLIQHPTRGWILYDTGYADHFFSATERWPERLYSTLLPVNLPASEILEVQLAEYGIAPADIALVIVSHYHGDHVAGLRNFPNARFMALQADTRVIKSLKGHSWRATFKGQLPQLLPADFFGRLDHANDCPLRDLQGWMSPFDQGFDLLGDGSLLGIPLAGHSHGQLGLLMPDADDQPVFLVADACWSLPACREGLLPSPITQFISADSKRYRKTFTNLRTLALREPDIRLLPSHCVHAWEEFNHGI